ncbi:hypothetical protein M405DRAFT_935767 [Rhizopogon salebrosus TDB-379]|nr:hypothetical protein M405DRAFT_935767 [Rhizopogon salebrosus TDB-379]
MDLEELLMAIIGILDGDDDPWVVDPLAWQLKPTKGALNSTKLIQKDSEDDVAQIRAQCATRRSALSGATNTNHGII